MNVGCFFEPNFGVADKYCDPLIFWPFRCGHCKSFAPTYEMVALKLHKTHSDEYQTRKIKVAKVDGAAERALASRFAVKGYPSFYLVEGWKVYPFEGTARSFDNLIKFANESYVEVEVRI